MTDVKIDRINAEYDEYCKNDGRKLNHLPFIIWLKQVAKIDPSDYYKGWMNLDDLRKALVDEMEIYYVDKVLDDYERGYNQAVRDLIKAVNAVFNDGKNKNHI